MTKIALVVFSLALVLCIQLSHDAGQAHANDQEKDMFIFSLEAVLNGLADEGVIDRSKIHKEDFEKAYETAKAKGKDKSSSLDTSMEEEKVLLYTGLGAYIEKLGNEGKIDRAAVEKKVFHSLPGGGKTISPELDSKASEAILKAYIDDNNIEI